MRHEPIRRSLPSSLAQVSVFALGGLALSCADGLPPPLVEPLKLADGRSISAQQLTHGREQYTLYCRPCHGDNGDGRGPAGVGLRPPPRNFIEPAFKFGGVEAGSLPPDVELKRIVKGGLHGTAMLPWQVPDQILEDILQYIKTFAKNEEGKNVWTEEKPGEPTEISEDPWKGKAEEAIQKGKVVYHGLAQCLKCHPAYATKQEIWDAVKESTGEGSTSAFREDMYNPDAKYSDAYKVKILPPDFIRHPVKAGSTERDLYRTIGSGIGGTAMPMWKGAIEEPELWALTYYVASLIRLNGTSEAAALRKKLIEQPEWTPPAGEGAAPEGGTE